MEGKVTLFIAFLAITSTFVVLGQNTTAVSTAKPTSKATTAGPTDPTTPNATTAAPTDPPTSKATTAAPTDPPTSKATTATPTDPPTTKTTAPPATSTAPPTTSTAPPITSTAPPTTSTAPPTTSTAPPTTSTAPPTTSTAPPTTSTAPPTTSTAPPTTSTVPPTTSTAPPTTSTAPPTTSTAPPTTSSAPKTTAGTTLPPPTLPPTPAKVSFNVNNGTNTSAILRLEIGLRLAINGSNGIKKFDLPANAAVSKGSNEGLTLTWSDMALGLSFSEDDDKAWDLSNLTLTYGKDKAKTTVKKNADDNTGILHVHASGGNAYKCFAKQTLALGDQVTATIVDLRVQPFMTGKENDFGKAQICEEDKEPDNVVPIAVGAALAALVVVVLVMYLIGRRRHQRGYQTV